MSTGPIGNSGYPHTSLTSTELDSASRTQATAQAKQELFSLGMEEKLHTELKILKDQCTAGAPIESIQQQAMVVEQVTSLLEDSLQAASSSRYQTSRTAMTYPR